ncbi:ATP-dependent DNA helicase PIF1 [Fusarium austroafricanum]|uniref:ATP-dependent DNA helicase PIF1 n=1 Tax=Fusarium austroafricanum TaxID=2364996 RepID=A0A8H4JLZ2_9HYPO|nr:ATP-dependent DNA helicase PIF1 [Fusarium austroafricanum]
MQERSILLPSAAVAWEQDNAVMLDGQIRATSVTELRRLLARIRLEIQDRSDVDLLKLHFESLPASIQALCATGVGPDD